MHQPQKSGHHFRQYSFAWKKILTNLLLRLWLSTRITILLDLVSRRHLYLPHQTRLVTLSFVAPRDLFCSLTRKVHHSSWSLFLWMVRTAMTTFPDWNHSSFNHLLLAALEAGRDDDGVAINAPWAERWSWRVRKLSRRPHRAKHNEPKVCRANENVAL